MRDWVHERPARQSRSVLGERPGAASSLGGDTGERTPRIGAKALITARDRVLLIKERHADGGAFWTLPGGGVDADESLPACLHREVDEELQCRATAHDVVGSYVYAHTSREVTTVYAVFETTIGGVPEPNADEQILDYAWRAPDDLPPGTLDPVAELIERGQDASAADD